MLLIENIAPINDENLWRQTLEAGRSEGDKASNERLRKETRNMSKCALLSQLPVDSRHGGYLQAWEPATHRLVHADACKPAAPPGLLVHSCVLGPGPPCSVQFGSEFCCQP